MKDIKVPLFLLRFFFRMNRREQVRIYRKLESLLRMQRPLAEALEMLGRYGRRSGKFFPSLSFVALHTWQRHLARGRPFSEALEGWVPERDALLLKAGEKSGQLGKALMHLLGMEGLLDSLKKALSQALGYLFFLTFSLILLILVMDQQMIAPFQKIAPYLVEETSLKTLSRMARFLNSWGIPLSFLAVFMAFLFTLSLSRWTGKSRSWFDKMPPWSWYRLWQGSGALLGLSSLLYVQVPAPEALSILENRSQPWLAEKLRKARLQMWRGRNLGEALRGDGMNFPDEEFASDLEIFALRGDIGLHLETLVQEWIRLQVEALQFQAQMVRVGGLAIVGGFLIWIASSLYGLYDALEKMGAPTLSFIK